MGWEGLRTMGTALAGLQLTPPNPPPPRTQPVTLNCL